jgi:hypothetical protein
MVGNVPSTHVKPVAYSSYIHCHCVQSYLSLVSHTQSEESALDHHLVDCDFDSRSKQIFSGEFW